MSDRAGEDAERIRVASCVASCEPGERERADRKDERRPRTPHCPASGTAGVAVGWVTVAAQLRVPLPPKRSFFLCKDPACPVVYFSDQGAPFEREALHVDPGFKRPGDGPVCYCFGHLESNVRGEVASTGSSTVVDAIRERIRSDGCACEARNPTGRCCLPDVIRLVRSEVAGWEGRR